MALSTETLTLIVAGLGSAAGVVMTAAVGGWWLRDQFANNREHTSREIASHEIVDQGRHRDNVTRFEQSTQDVQRRFEEQNEDIEHRFAEQNEAIFDIRERLATMGNGRRHH